MKKYLTDTKRSIVLFFLVFIVYALVYMTKNCYSAAMASIVNDGIMTKSQTGLISAMFYLIYAPFQIVGGMAADRFSPSKLILLGITGAGIANTLVFFFHESYIAMIVIWSLNAIVQFGVWPAVFRIIATQLAPCHRTKGIFYIGLSSIAGLLFSYISAVFITQWKYHFLLSAIILFVSAAVFYILYTYCEKAMTDEPLVSEDEVVPDASEKKHSTLSLMIKSGVPIMLISYTVLSIMSPGLKALAPVMLMENYSQITPEISNALNTLLVLASPVGYYAAKLPLIRDISPIKLIAGCFVVLLPLVFVITLVGNISFMVVLISLVVLMLINSTITLKYTFITNEFARFGCVATISGTFNCMSAIGIVIANYVFASFADNYGWGFTTNGFFVISVVAVVTAIAVIPVWNKFLKKSI